MAGCSCSWYHVKHHLITAYSTLNKDSFRSGCQGDTYLMRISCSWGLGYFFLSTIERLSKGNFPDLVPADSWLTLPPPLHTRQTSVSLPGQVVCEHITKPAAGWCSGSGPRGQSGRYHTAFTWLVLELLGPSVAVEVRLVFPQRQWVKRGPDGAAF